MAEVEKGSEEEENSFGFEDDNADKVSDTLSLLLLVYSRAESWVIHQFMSLKYEPSSEPLHNSATLA